MIDKTSSSRRRRQCAAMEVHFRLCEEDPGFRRRQVDIERFTSRRLLFRGAARPDGLAQPEGPVTIPVVVHVIYKKTSENISDAQVQSQIDVLNQDYRAKNPDVVQVPDIWRDVVGDAGIEFVLATQDPAGNPTTGITRTKTNRRGFGTHDSVKFDRLGGKTAWPTDKYLNIWVCTLIGGTLGYAQFPGGPARTDGVVITNEAFGTEGTAKAPFDKGRTTTHEIGHWLNLYHIWGDQNDCSGTDYVDDTPTQQLPNYGEPTYPSISCSNAPHGDMFMNYMDYVDDAAMCMFTREQVERITATLEGPRTGIGAS